jgi:hypothetical protein
MVIMAGSRDDSKALVTGPVILNSEEALGDSTVVVSLDGD